MRLRTLQVKSERYFEGKGNAEVTLAGLTRALGFKEGDFEEVMGDSSGREMMLDIYLELAEKMESAANKKPSAHRSDMLKGLNKFVGGLYSYEKSAKQQYLTAKTSFASIPELSQQRLMSAIASRNIDDYESDEKS